MKRKIHWATCHPRKLAQLAQKLRVSPLPAHDFRARVVAAFNAKERATWA